MKKKIIGIGIIVIIVLALVILFITAHNQKSSNKYLIELSKIELKEKIDNKEDFILVISRESCSHCAEYLPVLENVLTDYKVKGYYIDTDSYSEDDKKYVNELAKISGTPTTIFIENGEEKTVINRIVGTATRNEIVEALENKGYIK